MKIKKLICPCCFSQTLSTRGRFEICEVCDWEDDGQDDADGDKVRGGPNGDLSLAKARENYAIIRANAPSTITVPQGISEDSFYTLMNHKDGSAIATLSISCPPGAPEAWRKRLAVFAACERDETGALELLCRADLSQAYLRGVDLSGHPGQIDFFQALLNDADLSHAALKGVRMIGASLCNANLSAVVMTDVVLHYARFDGAILARARMTDARFTYGWMRGSDLRCVNAYKCDFSECDLSDANMAGGRFEECCFDEATLTGANIEGSDFRGSTFTGTALKGLDVARAFGI